jgi:hypothetical protein
VAPFPSPDKGIHSATGAVMGSPARGLQAALPSGHINGSLSAPTVHGVAAPVVPAPSSAPFGAPRRSGPSIPPPAAAAAPRAPVPRPTSPILIAFLVLLAAAAAAITVYFVLPLLT